jgi:hypothetical protein
MKGVTDGNNLHFDSEEGEQKEALVTMAKSIHSDFHHSVDGMRLALHEKLWLSLEHGEESCRVCHTSFHVSATAKHPFNCVCFRKTFFHMLALAKTSFDITDFPKKPEVSISCPFCHIQKLE